MADNSKTPNSHSNKSIDDAVDILSNILERLIELKSNKYIHQNDRVSTLQIKSLFDKIIQKLMDCFTEINIQQNSVQFNKLLYLVLKYLFIDVIYTSQKYPGGNTIVQADGSFIYDETHTFTNQTVDPTYINLVDRTMYLYKHFEINDLSDQIIHGITEWIYKYTSNIKSISKY